MFLVQVIVLTLQTLRFQQSTQNQKHLGPPQHTLGQCRHPNNGNPKRHEQIFSINDTPDDTYSNI